MLVDTSVWISHFRRSNADLEFLLEEGRIHTHPFVIGELACGSLGPEHEALTLLAALPTVAVVTTEEVLHFIHQHKLSGSGLGWVDMHLLASAKLTHESLWSTDRKLREAALRLGLAGAPPTLHRVIIGS